MSTNLLKLLWLPILFLIFLVSCSTNIEDAIDTNIVQDKIITLSTLNLEKGYIVFFEKESHKDIGVAFIPPSKEKRKTSINGYLSQNDSNHNWHYSASELSGTFYSVYYGTLAQLPKGKVYIEFKNAVRKEATVLQASQSLLWTLVINERFEQNELKVALEES
jgi:hypothetical protein